MDARVKDFMKVMGSRTYRLASRMALLFILGCLFPLGAQEFDRYCNGRYGFCVDYPSHFKMESPPENDDGRQFHDDNDFRMTASGINNVLEDTLQSEMKSQGEELDNITYEAKGRNWFILSGYKGSSIAYLKAFVGAGSINHLYIEYPAHLKAGYDEIVSKMASSFTPGRLEVVH